jgi:hypothetical protein
MSYKYTILSDHPIMFYQNVTAAANTLESYTELISSFSNYTSFLQAYPNYTAVVANTIYDISGCQNDGEYFGSIQTNLVPLLTGQDYAIKIDNDNYITASVAKDYNGLTETGGLADKYTSDNDFTLEAWIYPNLSTTSEVTLFGDASSNIGLFYDNGNLVFRVESQEIFWTIPYLKKAMHVVATYTGNDIALYIDGVLRSNKILNSFKFTNTSFTPSFGPTPDSSNYFLLNAPAVYRYALDVSRIQIHYLDAQTLPAIQIADPDSGEIFEFYDNDISTAYKYAYPANKPWSNFITDDLYYDSQENSISIKKSSGTKTVVINDFITIPLGLTIDSSKIEWDGDNGISIRTSVDGATYENCVNGGPIPQYKLGSIDSSYNLYLEITLESTDSSKYLPKLYGIIIKFYNDQVMYSTNGGNYFSTLEGTSGPSVFDVALGNQRYPILSRDSRNGIRSVADSGFIVNATSGVRTLQFFYTPSSLTDSGLVNSIATGIYSASNYSWRNSGTISKSNISAIYVNGIDKTSETNVSNVFEVGQMHHVLVVLSSDISGAIKFNYSLYGAVEALYQNITLYPSAFNSTKSLAQYDLYRYKSIQEVLDSNTWSIQLTENSVTPYNNDWIVQQNV